MLVTRPESEVRPRPPSPLVEVVTPDSKPTNVAKGSSNTKLTPNLGKYNSYIQSDCTNIIVDSDVLKQMLADVSVCRECGSDLRLTLSKKYGLASELVIEFEGRTRNSKFLTSPKVTTIWGRWCGINII